MKKITTLFFALTLVIGGLFISGSAAAALGFSPTPQIDYMKRKTRKVAHRTKYHTKRIAHKTKRGTKVGYYKTKRGTKVGYSKTKHATKKTYSKTKDKIQN